MKTKILDYGMNGEGVAKIDGKVALITGALVDEVVEFEVVEDNKNYCVGKLEQIIETSKQRISPPCPYFSSCGGCDLQHMAVKEQAKFKTQLVQKTKTV